MRRSRKNVFRIAVVVLFWAPIFVVAAGFARGAPSDFSGFGIGAKASSSVWSYDQPSLGVPAEPTGEFNVAFSQADLLSGPSSYGLGSVAWPGQVAAALPSFLQGEFQSNCGCELPSSFPNYPVRAESFHPQGPPSQKTQAGSMTMSSVARADGSEGVAHANNIGFPGVGGAGSESSFSSTGFDSQGAVAMVDASADDVSFLGGLITMDSVRTVATARSDGVIGTVSGGTIVQGAEVQGTPVVIDSGGVHVADQGIGSAAQQQAVNAALAGVGVSMQTSKPVDTIQGAQATRSLGGVLVTIKSSTVDSFVEALPDPLENEIRNQITFDQAMSVQLAPAVVSAVAARNLVFEPPSVAAPTVPASGGTTPSTTTTTGGSPAVAGGDATTPGLGSPTDAGGIPLAAAPASGFFGGVPMWLVIAFTLFALGTSRPLVWAADKVLALRATTRCPLEG